MDYELIRTALQTALENDQPNRAIYAKAKWDLDKSLMSKPSLIQQLTNVRDELHKIHQSLVLNERDLEEDLEAAHHYVQLAIDAQYLYENREDDTGGLEEYHDNKRRERGEWQ